MFEHLGPSPEVNIEAKKTNYRLYLSLLLFSVFVFMFSLSFSKGTHSQAQEPDILSAKIFVDASDKKIVETAKNISVFDFVVETANTNTSLYKLNILVNGVYNPELIGDLKLFHGDVQLGQINKMDDSGKIYFDLEEYKLQPGKNKFSLTFKNGHSLKNSSVLQFSIEDKEDIFLISDGQVFRPQADFPLASGLISVLSKGQVLATNTYRINDFIISSDLAQQITAFELSSIGESADLKKISLTYTNLDSDHLQNLEFVLFSNDRLIAQTVSQNGQIIFDIADSIVLQDLARQRFEVHALAMPEGNYQFLLSDVQAQGMWSGQSVSLTNKIFLSKIAARPYFIQFTAGLLNKRLSAGWNKIYSIKLNSQGNTKLYLNKISWQIDSQNVDIEDIELWRDGKVYIADVILKDNKIIVKTEGNNPLEIGNETTELLLLANLKNVGKKAYIEAFVLPDKQPIDGDILKGNIIWSDGDNFYNAYKMPYLPLEPSILSN